MVDDLPDELLPDAISALTHLEVDDEPLSEEELANLEVSREDIKHGRVYGPFETHQEFVASLEKEIAKLRVKKTKRAAKKNSKRRIN